MKVTIGGSAINNTIRTLLIHASMPPTLWAEALATASYVLNWHLSSSVGNKIPHQLLHGTFPEYSHLRVFGCLCYPNVSATTPPQTCASFRTLHFSRVSI
jgi:hypothetical protein